MAATLRVLVALAALLAGGGLSATPLHGVVEVAGKLVPLPPGEWLALAETIEMHGSDAFATRALARLEAGAVEAMVIIRANAEARPIALGGPRECSRDDIHLAHVAYDTVADGLCLFVNHVVLSEDVAGPPVWLAAREQLAAMGAVATDTWLAVGIRARTSRHLVDVRYYFAPPDFRSALPARDWSDNRWSPGRSFGDADRRASIRRLGVWANWTREAVELGLRGQIPHEALPPSPWGGSDLGQRLTARRMVRLDQLRALGRIAPAEYERQRRHMERVAIDPELSELPLWQRSLWKRLTQGAASAAESLGVSYLVIGSLLPSLGFTAIFEAASPIGSYLHELVWPGAADAHVGPSGPRDFAEIGRNE